MPNSHDEIKELKVLEYLIAGLADMLMLATIVVFVYAWDMSPV